MNPLILVYRAQIDLAQRRNGPAKSLNLGLRRRHIIRNRITLLRKLIAEFIIVAQLPENIVQLHIQPANRHFG
ncbi:hypothetical protein D3C71_1940360 [compost metagenome]